MPDLDHLRIDGTTYDLKDSTARAKDAVQDNELDQLKSAINNTNELYINGVTVVYPNYMNKASSGGKPTTDNNTRLISEPIPVMPDATVGIAKTSTSATVVLYLFDATDTLIGYKTALNSLQEYIMSHCDHVRVAVYYTNNADISPSEGLTLATLKFHYDNPLEGDIEDLENSKVGIVFSKNLVNIADSTTGKFIANGYGDLSDSSTYDTSDYIKINGNKIVFSKKIRKLLAYNSSKQNILDSYVTDEQSAGYVYTPGTNAAYIRVSYYHSDRATFQAEYGETPTDYMPYGYDVFDEGIHLSETMKDDISSLHNTNDVLYGKKWVACGDSFTHGDFQYSTDDNTIPDGMYQGQLKVYPFLIGNRTGMTVINEAVNGSCMTHIDGRTNAFSDTRYTSIASDADYITLKFGINDDASHQNVPIGTIDDATNETFYGAWNVVMSYLIAHHLDAKIGIIITNGATLDIANATIAIAEKWGVPYLNEATGKQCSFVFRSNRTDIPSSVRNAKNANWYVSDVSGSVNHHPNAKAHEFESSVVEAWLRSL